MLQASARTTSAQKIPSSPSVSSAKKNLDVSLASCDSNINTSMDLGCGNLSLTPAGKVSLSIGNMITNDRDITYNAREVVLMWVGIAQW